MIYLASASPRRRELLRQIGVEFDTLPTNIEERPRARESARDYVVRMATAKAQAAGLHVRRHRLPPRPILAADTEVVIDSEILGKPADAAHARALLRRLAGRTHDVLTAVALLTETKLDTVLSESRVTFANLSDNDIERYWATGEPADKAGGYAIQGHAAVFVTRIHGSYTGIVGLPLYEVARLLRKIGVALP